MRDRSSFPIYKGERNGPFFCLLPQRTGREATMPGIDFDKLRADITMEQVLVTTKHVAIAVIRD